MKFEDFIGQTFYEKDFYELLLFDIEEKFETYFGRYIHIYFSRVPKNKIKIDQVTYCKNPKDSDNESRANIEKKEWFEIVQNSKHFDLVLIRLDRSGYLSSVWSDSETMTQVWSHGWADENEFLDRPLTPEEIRQGIQELMGFFEDQQEVNKLKSKKAV